MSIKIEDVGTGDQQEIKAIYQQSDWSFSVSACGVTKEHALERLAYMLVAIAAASIG